jgi:hypothetical protein
MSSGHSRGGDAIDEDLVEGQELVHDHEVAALARLQADRVPAHEAFAVDEQRGRCVHIAQVETPHAGKIEDDAQAIELGIGDLEDEGLFLLGAGRFGWWRRGRLLGLERGQEADALEFFHPAEEPRRIGADVEVGKNDAAAREQRLQAHLHIEMGNIEHGGAFGIDDEQPVDGHGGGPVGDQVEEQTRLPANGLELQLALHFG